MRSRIKERTMHGDFIFDVSIFGTKVRTRHIESSRVRIRSIKFYRIR